MKFGGTSVRDATAIRRLCAIVARESRPRLIVVSALAGVTDRLVALGRQAGGGDAASLAAPIDWLRQRHTELTSELVSGPARDALLTVIESQCRELESLVHAVAVLHELSPRSADAIAAFGESLSSRLIAAALSAAGSRQ